MRAKLVTRSHAVVACFGMPVLLAVLLCLPAAAKAELYQFTKIADTTSGVYRSLRPWPAVNASGHVLFHADLHADLGTSDGLFLSDGSTITTVAIGTPYQFPVSLGTDQVINNADQVAYFGGGLNMDHTRVCRWSGGSTTLIADASSFSTIGNFGPSMNNNGTVVFPGTSLATGRDGIYSGSGGAITTVIDTSSQFSSFGYTPTINDSGTVAFCAVSRTTGRLGAYTTDHGVVTEITDTSGPIAGIVNGAIEINNAGTVAFEAQLASGGYAIYRGDAQSLEMVADTSGVFVGFMDQPIVNNQGQVAFFAYVNDGGAGIYTGPDPVADKIVATGDVIDGETLTYIYYLGAGFADNGWVAFVGETQSGKEIVYVGHPVPEPSTLILIAVGVLGLVACVRQRRCS